MSLWVYSALAAIGLYVYHTVNVYRAHRADQAHDKQNHCLPPPSLQNKWPLGFDNVLEALKATSEGRLNEHLLSTFRRLGPTYQQVLAGEATIMTIEPANLEAILSSPDVWGIGMRRKITLPMFGDGIFTQNGEAWKHSRDLLRPRFSHRAYDDLEVYREAVDGLIHVLSEKKGHVVDLQHLFFRLTLDVTTKFLFGESVCSLRSSNPEFEAAFDVSQKIVASRFRFQKLYWLVGGAKFKASCKTIHDFADNVIRRKLERAEQDPDAAGDDFLCRLIQDCADHDALRGQVVNVLTAGRDSTACLLAWTFFHLVRHPHVMQKLRDEISELDAGRSELRRSHLSKLKYLQATLKEVLRLHPSTPLGTRTSLQPATLPTGGGPDQCSPISIAKGTTVMFSQYSLHRRPEIYGMDAAIFRPERWESGSAIVSEDPTHQKMGYMPFGAGSRTCLGMDFALTEAAYAIVSMLQAFPSIMLPEDEKVELVGLEKQTVTIVLRSTDGCKVVIG
ncbi:cytochrome P450 monooxygenase [Pseudomassariella vexata]|uniref:Cytochrome P450 monooxygenase n=1 Tax=Pseudomassariella vexata TaxID=1141098 RepID=A0A1Y2DP64_9PEZI|nr:cytochrome P450 monooxygenase [Pseudomassariella vexata]ORY60997.1 cytochrome P450 monooxygenase [Pseudomassariella vexata]